MISSVIETSNIVELMAKLQLMIEKRESMIFKDQTLISRFSYFQLEPVVLVSIYIKPILLSSLIQIGILKWIYKLLTELIVSAKSEKSLFIGL